MTRTTAMASRCSSRRIFRANRATTIVLLLVATSFISFVSAGEPEPRIVGGQNADINEYPWFTAWGKSCGATLIHDDILLTAAHCNPLETNQVIVGAYAKGIPMANSEIRNIQRRIIHPRYNVQSWNYDVMLLKLDEPVTDIPKVALNADKDVPTARSTVTPIGLGRLAEVEGEFPDVLQDVNVRVIDSNTCNRSPMYPGWIQDTMICAGVLGGGQDACFGDSGGPLVQKDFTTGEVTQVGVVSFGTGCARSNKPGVYHRVSSSYDWIQQAICTYSSSKPSTCASEREAALPQQVAPHGQPQQEEEPQPQATKPPTPLPTPPPTQPPTKQPQQPQPLPELVEQNQVEGGGGLPLLYTHPENPPLLPLGMCEGDCDRDSDCEPGLYCFYKTHGYAQTVPGCDGRDDTSTDFCVDLRYRNAPEAPIMPNSASSPIRQSTIFGARNGGLRGGKTEKFRSKAVGLLDGEIRGRVP